MRGIIVLGEFIYDWNSTKDVKSWIQKFMHKTNFFPWKRVSSLENDYVRFEIQVIIDIMFGKISFWSITLTRYVKNVNDNTQ